MYFVVVILGGILVMVVDFGYMDVVGFIILFDGMCVVFVGIDDIDF